MFKNIALFISACIVCLFAGELFVRIVVPQQLILHDDIRIHCPDSVTEWRHLPNNDVMVNLGERTVRMVTDENGYRINTDADCDTTDAGFSILTLGDSFLEGLQVESEQTMPQVIVRLLKDQYDIDAQVDNSGVGGWDPSHYYLEAKQALERREYDLGIVFIYTDNDFVDVIDTVKIVPDSLSTSIHRFRMPESLTWSEFILSTLYPVNDYLERRSHLFILFKTRGEFLLSKVGLTAYYFPDVFLTSERESVRWEVTGTLCELTANVFNEHDVLVIFVLLPASYQVDEELFYCYVKHFSLPIDSVDLEQPSKLLAEQCKQRSLNLIDMLEPMRERAEQGKVMYGTVDRHFNAEGHYVVAEHVVPRVATYLMR